MVKESFYGSFGYVGTNDNLLVKISLDGFSHYLGDVSKIKGTWEEKNVYLQFHLGIGIQASTCIPTPKQL